MGIRAVQDLAGTMLGQWFGSRAIEDFLEARANWFFFHGHLDQLSPGPWDAPRWGLRGLALVVLLYNVMVYALFRAYDRLAAAYDGLQTHIHNQQARDATLIDIATDEQPRLRLVGTDGASRRAHERIVNRAPVAAVAMDVIDRATVTLDDAALIDVSEGGLALRTTTPIDSGQFVLVRGAGAHLASGEPVRAMVLEQLPFGDRYRLRCRHEAGPKPTKLADAA